MVRFVEALPLSTCARSSSASAPARPRARGRTSSTSRAREYFDAQPGGLGHLRAALARGARGRRHPPLEHDRAARVGAGHRRSRRLDPAALDPRLGAVDADAARGLRRGDRQHRVSARPRRLQHPARDHRGHRPPARRLRARQGGDAQRRRRRRDDLRRSSTTSTRARPTGSTTRSRSTTSRRSCVFGSGLDNQRAVTVKSTFLQNRDYLDLLLPRGVHGGGDGGRARSATRSTRSPTSTATRSARRSTSPSSRSTSGSSTTPPTRPTRKRARSEPAGLSYYGMDSTYASSLAIVRRVLALEGVLDAP